MWMLDFFSIMCVELLQKAAGRGAKKKADWSLFDTVIFVLTLKWEMG